MKVIVAGSRTIRNYQLVSTCIEESSFLPSVIIQGGAAGVDRCAARWAREHNVECVTVKANWLLLGRKAGPIRNQDMAGRGDALVLIWDGKSKGSASMKDAWLKKHDRDTMMEYILSDNSIRFQ